MAILQLTSLPSASSRPAGKAALRNVAISIAVLLSGVAVHAQTTTPAASAAPAFTPGLGYFALNAGSSDLSQPISGLGVVSGPQTSQAIGVAVGNYALGQNYGFEVGYADLGSVTRNGGTTKVDGINLSVLGRLPMSANFNLLGKIGTTYSRTDVTTNSANSSLAGSEHGFDWAYGVGAELLLSQQVGLTLQYAEHFVKYPSTGHDRVSSTTLGLRYYY